MQMQTPTLSWKKMNSSIYCRSPQKMYNYPPTPSLTKPREAILPVHSPPKPSENWELKLTLTKTAYWYDAQPATARSKKSYLLNCCKQSSITPTVRRLLHMLAARGISHCVLSYTRSVLVSEQDQYSNRYDFYLASPAMIYIRLEHRKLLYPISYAPRRTVAPTLVENYLSGEDSSFHPSLFRSVQS